jgi:hypothetical protein
MVLANLSKLILCALSVRRHNTGKSFKKIVIERNSYF